jgi:hypothetical protein
MDPLLRITCPTIPIEIKDRLVCGVGASPTLGGKCYVVLTKEFFAWHTTPLPIDFLPLFPPEYCALPLGSITSVTLKPGEFMTLTTLCIEYTVAEGHGDIAVSVAFRHLWVDAFRRVGILVDGAECASLGSALGFLNNYGWFLWTGMWALAFAVRAARDDPNPLYWFWAFAVTSALARLAIRLVTNKPSAPA